MNETKIKVTGMKCQGCVQGVGDALRAGLPAVKTVTVDLPQGLVSIGHSGAITAEEITGALATTKFKLAEIL